MRTTQICLVVLLVAFMAYAYAQDPSGCKKVVDDARSVLITISPIPLHPDVPPKIPVESASSVQPEAPAPSTIPAPVPVPATTPPPTPTPVPAPAALPAPTPASESASTVPNPPLPLIKTWAPPAVMPAQFNWTWTTSDGKTYQNVVVNKIEADTVSITHSTGVAHVPISLLPPDIQKQLNYDPQAASQIPALISEKLVSADGTAVSMPGASVQYYAIYYSAQWCPPCHAFTPHLVKWYNGFKPTHPNFELIFVSEDRNEAAMLSYMKEMAMPWLAVRFGDLKHDGGFKGSGIEKFAGDGIPDLVLVDVSGKVLSDSYQNGTYVGPEAVVDDINKLIGGTSPVPFARQNLSAPTARPTELLEHFKMSYTSLGIL